MLTFSMNFESFLKMFWLNFYICTCSIHMMIMFWKVLYPCYNMLWKITHFGKCAKIGKKSINALQTKFKLRWYRPYLRTLKQTKQRSVTCTCIFRKIYNATNDWVSQNTSSGGIRVHLITSSSRKKTQSPRSFVSCIFYSKCVNVYNISDIDEHS